MAGQTTWDKNTNVFDKVLTTANFTAITPSGSIVFSSTANPVISGTLDMQSLSLSGDLTVSGTAYFNSIVAVTSSYSSGSTIFGDALSDTHQFTGSVFITGSSLTWNNSTLIASNVTSAMSVASSSQALTASYFNGSVTSASYASQAGNSSTINISVFGSPVDSYLLMSNVAGTTGVAIGGDADLRYNSSTNVLTVPNVSATTLTGSLLGTASNAVSALTASFYNGSVTSASYALTASFLQGTASTAISASTALTASKIFITNLALDPGTYYPMFANSTYGPVSLFADALTYTYQPSTNILTVTSSLSLGVSASSINSNNNTAYDTFNIDSINWDVRRLSDAAGNGVLDWNGYTLLDNTSAASIDWSNREIYDETSKLAIKYNTRREMYDESEVVSLDWGDRWLKDPSGTVVLDWATSNIISVTGSLNSPNITGSLLGTSSWATNALTASLAPNYVLTSTTSSMLSPYVLTSSTSSMSVLSSSFAATASRVNTLNQNVIITGSVAIGTGSVGGTENNLILGPAPGGGTGEGGQIALLAVNSSSFVSSSFIDNYQNQIRILAGTGTTSTAGVLAIDLGTKAATFQGTVSATGYSGLPNNYLYVTRNTNQTIGSGNWANQDIIFNNSVVSSGISYNTGTGLASLTGGKVYRITARLAWSAAATYLLEFSCYNSSNSQIGPSVQMVQSTNGSFNISDGTLDFIYAPGSNVDIKIRTTANTTALSGEYIRGDLNTQLIIQQIA